MSAETLWERWRRFWFADTSAMSLAFLRILVSVHALWILLSRDFAAISSVPAPFRSSIRETVRLRYLIFEGYAGLDVAVQWVATVALVLAIVGVVPRVACFVAALAIYHLAPLEGVTWTFHAVARGLTIAPVALLLLAFSRSGDALTVFPKARSAGPSWQYGWPIRVVQLLVVQIYFFAGVGKLVQTGPSWASAENIRRWLVWANNSPEISVFRDFGLWIADHPLLCGAIGIGTFAFELSSPLVLFFRRAALPFVALAISFHLGILLSMNIYVGEGWYLFAFLLGRTAHSVHTESPT